MIKNVNIKINEQITYDVNWLFIRRSINEFKEKRFKPTILWIWNCYAFYWNKHINMR